MTQSNIIYADLLFPTDLTKGIYESKGGKVGVPDRILTQSMIINALEVEGKIKEWIKDYDFHYAQFQIGVDPDEGYLPEYVKIRGEMNPELPPEERPIIPYIFPHTDFVKKNYSIEGKFLASAGIGFQQLQALNTQSDAGVKGELKISFQYNPTIPIIDSAANGNIFYWNFRKNGNKIPIGGLDLHMIIERPRKTLTMRANWTIHVKYKKKFMGKDTAITIPPMITDLIFKESIII